MCLDDLRNFNVYYSSQKSQIVPPSPDIQPIIDRMAMYVAKNGEEFEIVVKSKKDARFGFLERGHVHFEYYNFKKNLFIKVTTKKLSFIISINTLQMKKYFCLICIGQSHSCMVFFLNDIFSFLGFSHLLLGLFKMS